MISQIIKISLTVSILGLFSGCGGLSKQEIIAKELAQKERQLKYQKIRDNKVKARKLAKIKAKEVEEKKREDEQAKQDATVEALGYGNTKKEALKNAFSSAVSEYVGILVDSKEVMRNGRLIEDKILTFSNGYIDSYKTISSKEQMGLWEVKISAVIKQQQVLSQIKKLKIEAIDIKDSENRYAKITSQIKTKFEAEDMIIALVTEVTKNYNYLSLNIDSLDIDTDLATRKYVPIKIKYSVIFNWNEYQKIIEKFEKLFKSMGAKVVEVGNISPSGGNYSMSVTSVIGNYRNGNQYKSDGLNILVVKKEHGEIIVNKWKFPKQYAVIYPFRSSRDWMDYSVDEERKYIKRSNTKFNLVLVGNNKKKLKINIYDGQWGIDTQIFKTIYGGVMNHGGYTGSNSDKIISPKFWILGYYYPFNGSGIDNYKIVSYQKQNEKIHENSFRFDMPIRTVETLKQVKFEWEKDND